MQAVTRKPREKATRNLDRAKPRRVNLDATALEFRTHELDIVQHVMRHKNTVFQEFSHLFGNRCKLRLAMHHFVGNTRQMLHKRLNRHTRVNQCRISLDYFTII